MEVMLNEEPSHFELELEDGQDNYSPNRTRSGCIYTIRSRLKRDKVSKISSTRVSSVSSCEEEKETVVEDPVSGIMFFQTRERKYQHDIPSSPVQPSSPMHLSFSSPKRSFLSRSSPFNVSSSSLNLDMDLRLSPSRSCTNSYSSPFTVSRPNFISRVEGREPRNLVSRGRLRFDSKGEVMPSSCPLPSQLLTSPLKASDVRISNVNPFTPEATWTDGMKRKLLSYNHSVSSNMDTSRSEYSSYDASLSAVTSDESDCNVSLPSKRLRVSDISVNRYEEEFIELANIASGQFGMVVKARHRLDGMVYAIKISRKNLRVNSHDEKMAMNEIFAHASIMKHKHVVRYFNSWIERGQIYIQNEFCDGGSLEQLMEECRSLNNWFSEEELHRILLHIAKGLKYIHSRKLVHLDIKPGNVLISFDTEIDDSEQPPATGVFPHKFLQYMRFKIGDLGHVTSIMSDSTPTEGDCRYMAPELMQMESPENALLPKADMFSTGLTVFETASLLQLPKNSEENTLYVQLKKGILPQLPRYSRKFHRLLTLLVDKEPSKRITSAKLVLNDLINPLASKSKSQLKRELHQANLRVAELEEKLGFGSL